MDVDVRGLVVDFPARGVRALAGVDLRVGQGEQLALLGPSGSGKTTLLRALLGGVRPTAGTVRVGGLDPSGGLAEVRRLRRATGFVRQGHDLVLGVSARANALSVTSWSWTARDWLVVARGQVPAALRQPLGVLAERHGLAGLLDARADQLSGGQRQRVGLVRALLPGPRLLLADEPTAGLDPSTAAEAVAALRETGGAGGTTVVVTTHDLAVARRFPRIVALRAGRIVHDAATLAEDEAATIYAPAPAEPSPAARP